MPLLKSLFAPWMGTIQLMIGATMISFSAVFVKLAHVGPTVAGFYRMFFGGLILLFLVLIRRQRLWMGWRPLLMAGACGMFFALDLTFWHRSVHYVGPGLSTLLANFQVFFLAGFGLLVLREGLSWRFGLSLPLAMTGLFLIVGINWGQLDESYRRGVALGLIAAACYAANILTLRQSQLLAGALAPMANLALLSLSTALIMGLEGWGEGVTFLIPDLQSWASLASYGVVSQVLGWIFISRGLLRVPASRAGLILLLQPTLAFVWDIVLFHRPTGLTEILGALLALAGIYVGAMRGNR